MKRIKKIIAVCLLIGVLGLTGCQSMTRSLGGTTILTLEPNTKLELITWKDDDSLWYLTRPMREDEEAETHVYKQNSNFGLIEGEVIIKEIKK